MRNWFTLTTYEFYAFLTSGMIFLASFDRVFMGSYLATQHSWTVVSGVFWAAMAYLIGQLFAVPSAGILENLIMRKFFYTPTEIILGFKKARCREKVAVIISAARQYSPFSEKIKGDIVSSISKELDCTDDELDAETVFQCAFPYARSDADTVTRLDSFMNQYGMCRNVSFAAFVSAIIFLWEALVLHHLEDIKFVIGLFILSIGMFLRFFKFYSAYARDVLRTYWKIKKNNTTDSAQTT